MLVTLKATGHNGGPFRSPVVAREWLPGETFDVPEIVASYLLSTFDCFVPGAVVSEAQPDEGKALDRKVRTKKKA